MEIGHSVAGGWLGTYWYGGADTRREPCRFEATFSAPGPEGRFSGTIVDDGPLGAANVSGVEDGRIVQFTKVYIRPPSGGTTPVEYQGTLAEDGRTMQGTWRLTVRDPTYPRPVRVHGSWEAHRLWEEVAETEAERQEAGQALVLAGPAERER